MECPFTDKSDDVPWIRGRYAMRAIRLQLLPTITMLWIVGLLLTTGRCYGIYFRNNIDLGICNGALSITIWNRSFRPRTTTFTKVDRAEFGVPLVWIKSIHANGQFKGSASYFHCSLVPIPLAMLGLFCWRTHHSNKLHDRCDQCHYSLVGLRSDICPECGSVTASSDGRGTRSNRSRLHTHRYK